MTKAINLTSDQGREAMSGNKAVQCQHCQNTYILIWLAQGDDYNDFGFRHCPFCGLLTDEITGSVIV